MLWQPPRELMDFYSRSATLGTSQRYRDAARAELYYLGRQYDGMPAWDDKSVPLAKRAPRLDVGLYKQAVDEIGRWVWGGHRFPGVAVEATRTEDEPESADEIGPRLDKEQAQKLTRFLRALIRKGKLERAAKEATDKALVTTSAAILLTVRSGFFTYHVEPGKHCMPTFDLAVPGEVARLEVRYQFPREEQIPGSLATRTVSYWYRRIIDAERDVVYQEVPVQSGREPQWVEDPARTVEHKLGFCPVRWWRTLPHCEDPIDGRPVIDPALYPALDDLNRIWSQKGRAVGYGCDPQPYRRGVPESEREALAKTPGQIWDLPAAAEAGFLEAKGDGAQRAGEHIRELTQAFHDAVGIVKASADHIKGDISGVVLDLLHRPMIALASDLRADLGEDGYVGLLDLALRLVTVVVGRGEDVWVPGVAEAAQVLQQAQLRGVWLEVPIAIKWSPFFPETPADKKAKVDTANGAVQGHLISQQRATEYVADVFGIEDPEAEHELIEAEQAEQADYGPMLQRRGGSGNGGDEPPDAAEDVGGQREIEAEPAEPGEE